MGDTGEPAFFFAELGHIKELRRVFSPEDAATAPWSLLSPDDCGSESWPSKALPTIATRTPEDALAQLRWNRQRWGLDGAHVVVMASEQFIDGEGALETARLLIDEGFFPILRAPLDWPVVTRLAEIGCPAVDIQGAVPGLEEGLSRPALLKRILEDVSIPILLSGTLLESEINDCLSQGVSAILVEN